MIDDTRINQNWCTNEVLNEHKKSAKKVLEKVKSEEGKTILIKHPTLKNTWIVKKVQK